MHLKQLERGRHLQQRLKKSSIRVTLKETGRMLSFQKKISDK